MTLVGAFAIAAIGFMVFRSVFAGSDANDGPTADNPLPVVLADGEARPTFTPVPAPASGTSLIDEGKAVEIATKIMNPTEAQDALDEDSVRAVLVTVGETNISLYDEEYPVWRVTGLGEFKPLTQKCCAPAPTFHQATLYLDGVDGKVLGFSLQDELVDSSN
jgi:hypothetical protein